MANQQYILQGIETRGKIYRFIRAYWKEHCIPPCIRDIQDGCDISSTSIVVYHLRKLRGEGLIDYIPASNRTIIIVGMSINLPAFEKYYA